MSLYGFTYDQAALEYLDTLPKKFRRQIKDKIQSLAGEPRPPGTKQLHEVTDGPNPVYRLRSGDYRILYSIRNETTIVVLDIGHRKDVYRRKG